MADVQVIRVRFDVDGRAIREAQADIRATEKQAGGLEGAISSIGPKIAAAFSVAAIGAFLKKSVELSAAFEQNVISIEQFTGSTAKAKKLLKELEQFAAKTPFEFPEIAESAKRLLAFGVGADKITDTLRRLGDIAAGTGKPLGEISLIYGQVLAKGKLQGEELLQFAEKGVPLLDAVAKVLGKSTAETQALITKGQVGFPVVEKAIQSMTDAGGKFAGLTQKQSQSLSGLLSTAKDNILSIAKSIGDFLSPAIKTALSLFNSLFGPSSVATRVDAVTKEQGEINALVTSITGVNDNNKVRRDLLNELNESYPGFLKNLNVETVTNEQLRDRLAEVNEQYRKKIILAANEDKIAQKAKEVQEIYQQLTDAYKEAGDAISLYNQFNKNQTSTQADVITQLEEMLMALEAFQQGSGAPVIGISASEARELIGRIQSLNSEFNQGTKDVAELQQFLNGLNKEFGVMEQMTGSAAKNGVQPLNKELAEAGSLGYMRKIVSDLEAITDRLSVGSPKWTEYTEKLKAARTELEFLSERAKLLSGEKEIETVTPIRPGSSDAASKVQRTGEELGKVFKDGFSHGSEPITEDLQSQIEKFLADIGPYVSQVVGMINEIFDIQSELIQRNLEEELAAIDAKSAKEIQAAKGNRIEIAKIEKKYAIERAREEAKAARQRKQIAISQAIIDGALAVMKNFATFPYPVAIAFSLITAGITAAQVALISSQKFAKGVIDLQGPGSGTSDSIPARLSKGESVMTARETKEWKPLLKAIRRRDVVPGPMGMPMFRAGGSLSVNASLNDDRIVKELKAQRHILLNMNRAGNRYRTSEFADKPRSF